MQRIRHAPGAVSRNYHSWTISRLLPPILLELNQSFGEDREIVPARVTRPARLQRP